MRKVTTAESRPRRAVGFSRRAWCAGRGCGGRGGRRRTRRWLRRCGYFSFRTSGGGSRRRALPARGGPISECDPYQAIGVTGGDGSTGLVGQVYQGGWFGWVGRRPGGLSGPPGGGYSVVGFRFRVFCFGGVGDGRRPVGQGPCSCRSSFSGAQGRAQVQAPATGPGVSMAMTAKALPG